jgi:AcrR family transcriptional regulator
MKNKEIQEQRMRGYFMQATKELLKGEGLRSINVRSIADQAGYSYATLYNYFRDVKELVFLCVTDFQEECTAEIMQKVEKTPRGIERIRAITKAYIGYSVQYPSVFNLFFIEKLGDLGQKQPAASLIFTFLERLCASEWKYCTENGITDENSASLIKQELNFVSCGMLLFYMNRIQPAGYIEFMGMVDLQLNSILNRCRAETT